MELLVRILGSGASTGVPIIGCRCRVCSNQDPIYQRTRTSILIRAKDAQIVVDTTPDFRYQMLLAKIDYLTHVLYTHTHADHCHGFDDLRAFSFYQKTPILSYAAAEHCVELKKRFSYAFQNQEHWATTPEISLHAFPVETFLKIGRLKIESVLLPHGKTHSLGFRIGKFAYVSDFKSFPDKVLQKWKNNIHTMIASGLCFYEHATHSSIQETCLLFKKLGVQRAVLTHLSHSVDVFTDQARLPKGVVFAYDGMELQVNV